MKKCKTSIGNKISISNKTYATLNNRFLDRIGSKNDRYDIDKASKEDCLDSDGNPIKGPRPIVIIWSNKYHDKVIAIPETSIKGSERNPRFKTSEGNYWKYDVLILEKNKIPKTPIWKKFKKDELNEFKNSWKISKKTKSYEYLEKKMLKYDSQSKQKLIDELLKNK